jgi:hypothetical protein
MKKTNTQQVWTYQYGWIDVKDKENWDNHLRKRVISAKDLALEKELENE